jgi:aspartate aminotransferase-like enzyme
MDGHYLNQWKHLNWCWLLRRKQMKVYPIAMVPGPVSVPNEILDAYRVNYGSADLEPEFGDLYAHSAQLLARILKTRQQVVIQTGEAMLALWGALKSCLRPGDRVLAIANGVFGYGIAEMAMAIGSEVHIFKMAYNETLKDMEKISQAIEHFQPKMITAVHCETPSGTLNPISSLGQLKNRHHVPLLYVDAVASIAGAPVEVDEWSIDLCLGGSQKCLSLPPEMTFMSVSDPAWEIIEKVAYVGYDALKPFRSVQKTNYFPYTPNWHGVSALNAGAQLVLEEGLNTCFTRHAQVAEYCRQRITNMGLSLFPAVDAVPSPTVTAVNIPDGIVWSDLDQRFLSRGLVVGGSFGPMAGKVFRLGHMGSQANMELVQAACDIIAEEI